MIVGEISIFIAFLAGLVSFIAPCILPLVPGYLAYLSGVSITDKEIDKKQVLTHSILFVLGFSTVFALIGVLLNTVLSSVAFDAQVWMSRIAGLVIIVFGLYLAKLVRIPFLDREYKVKVKTKFGSKYLSSFAFGVAFAAGWSPCVGAVLGGILALAATNPGSSFFLLFAYSLGLGLPFILLSFFISQANELIKKYRRWFNYLNIGFGYVLIILGILVFTQEIFRISNFGFVIELFELY